MNHRLMGKVMSIDFPEVLDIVPHKAQVQTNHEKW